MEVNVSTENPGNPTSWRTFLEWVLLGGAVVGYGVVYLAVIYHSALGFVAGLALCVIVAGFGVYLQCFRKLDSATEETSALTGRINSQQVFVNRVRKLIAVIRSSLK